MIFSEEQKQIINAPINEKTIVMAAAASGKAQPDFTIIPTPKGEKQLKDLSVGDYIFDKYGKKTKVLNIFPQGEKEVWEVTFNDNRTTLCCEEHLWTYKTKNNNEYTTKSLKDLYENEYKNNIKIIIPSNYYVEYNSFNNNKKIDFYITGHLLGKIIKTENSIDNIFLKKINKYLFMSVKNRLLFLKYIIDSNNNNTKSYNKIKLYIHNSNKKIINYIQKLSYSLGISFIFSDKLKNNEFLLCFFSTNFSNYLLLKHHVKFNLNKYLTITNTNYCFITKIVKKNYKVFMRCIEVDNSEHLYLTNDFIVTHNTAVLTERLRYLLINNVDPKKIVALTFTNNAANEMKERLKDILKPGIFIGTIHSYANYLLTSKGYDTTEIIQDQDFDELFEKILSYPNCIRPIDYLLCDETQDLNTAQYDFLLETLNPIGCLLVGDIRQCQPKGTKILLNNGILKNIEDIKKGDSIITYNFLENFCYNINSPIIKQVQNVNKSYTNKLINLTTNNNTSTHYTFNHKTFISFNYDKDNYILFLGVKNNDSFDIKIEKSTNKNWIFNASLIYKKIWILSYDNKLKIEKLYSIINKKNIKSILKYFKLDIKFPLIDCNNENFKHSLSINVFETFAINLLPEYMSILLYTNKNPNNYILEEIKQVRKIFYYKPIEVYSLLTENETYCADNIITHNSIYQFKGARPEKFARLMKADEYVVRKLSFNYRNDRKIIEKSNEILKKMKNIPQEKIIPVKDEPGEIYKIYLNNIIPMLKQVQDYKNWAILCRKNLTVNEIMALLEQNKIPCVGFKQAQLDLNELEIVMDVNKVKVLTIHSSKGLEFNNVIIIEDYWGKSQESIHLSYVAITRAKNKLYICNYKKR